MFPGLYYDLLVSLEENEISTIIHPTKGEFQALLRWRETVDADKRNGVALQIQWQEHNASSGKIVGNEEDNAPQPASTSAVINKAKTADAEASSVSTTYKPIASDLETTLDKLDASDTLTAPQIEGVFGESVVLVMGALADPGLSTALGHDAVIALEDTQSLLARLRRQYLGDRTTRRMFQVPAEMALWEVAVAATGDASKADIIAAANAIDDPLAIPAGTILVIPR